MASAAAARVVPGSGGMAGMGGIDGIDALDGTDDAEGAALSGHCAGTGASDTSGDLFEGAAGAIEDA
jgi:hypothetical protein